MAGRGSRGGALIHLLQEVDERKKDCAYPGMGLESSHTAKGCLHVSLACTQGDFESAIDLQASARRITCLCKTHWSDC